MQEVPEQNEKELTASFTDEVSALVEEEKRLGKTAHFSQDFNPEELTQEDELVWKKVQGRTITRNEIEEYRKSLLDPETGNSRSDVSPSRWTFYEFVANKGGAIAMERELAGITNKPEGKNQSIYS